MIHNSVVAGAPQECRYWTRERMRRTVQAKACPDQPCQIYFSWTALFWSLNVSEMKSTYARWDISVLELQRVDFTTEN